MVIISDIVNVRKRAASLDVSDQFDTYTKVVINISDKSYVSAGTDGGLTLTIDNPLGTQQMANDILYKLKGYRYQPFEAKTVLADPAAEIGDGLSVNNVYGGIYQNDLSFSRLMAADISAPQDNEIDHEFKYQPQTERKFSREIGDVKATLLLQSDMIAAKVDNTSAGQDFGWELLSDHWSVTSGGNEVFRIDENGGTFAGEVVAASGRIGGFTISATAIYNNISQFGGTQSSGVYIGPDGIQLGQGFMVDSTGHMQCTNATVQGTLRARDIQYGGSNGYFNGSGIGGGTIGTGQLNSYCLGGIGGGVDFNSATAYRANGPTYLNAGQIRARNTLITDQGLVVSGSSSLSGNVSVSGNFTYKNRTASWRSVTINGSTFYVLAN